MSPTKKERRAARTGSGSSRYSSRSTAVWWRAPWVLTSGAAAVVVAVVILLFVFSGNPNATSTASQSVPQSVLDAVTKPDTSVLEAVGGGGQHSELVRIAGTDTRTSAGKPDLIYVGAEYCPYCAAERWSMVIALSRFGTFKGLTETTSSETDVYPNTSTFSFHGSTYTSDYVTFRHAELYDRLQKPLDTPAADLYAVFQARAQPPYTSNKAGFPFFDIANRFELYGTSYSPQVLQNLTWDQIAADLKDPANPVTQAIMGSANYLTAAICVSTDNKPEAVCSAPSIKTLVQALTALPPVGS